MVAVSLKKSFFQAEDGIRDAEPSRGLGDVYKRQIYPLIARVVGVPQMISQPVSSILPCSPLPSGTWRTPGLLLSSHLFLCLPCLLPPFTVPCKMVLAPDLMNGRHEHTTAVCVSLRRSGGLRMVRLPAGSSHRLIVDNMVCVRDA